MQARLVVTHVLGYPLVTETLVLDDLPQIRKNNLKVARSRLENFSNEHLGDQWKTMKVQIAPVEDMHVVDGIVAIANDWHAEMIVVGTKGASALQEVLLGSTTKRLIKKAPCPVLAIPADTSYRSLKTIVYATDFEQEDVYAIQKVVEIAQVFDAEIKIVHITNKKEYSGKTQMEWFKDAILEKVTYEKLGFELLFSEDIFESLKIYLGKTDADLVVMLERKRSGFLKKWFHADKVKKMESFGRWPLLSFNEANLNVFYFSSD